MKKKIYYVVDIEFHDNDYDLGATGHKKVIAYEIDTTFNELKEIVELSLLLEDNSQETIQRYLDDNHEGEEFELIQL